MAITKKPTNRTANAFMSGAPEALDTPRRVRKGHKVQITLTIAEPLLDRVNELANQIGKTRVAVINLAVMQLLQSGLHIDGEQL